MFGTYIAYAITTQGKGCEVVRVVNSMDDRIHMKGMIEAIVDLSFAHINEEVVVGVVDSMVMEGGSGLASERVVEVLRDGGL